MNVCVCVCCDLLALTTGVTYSTCFQTFDNFMSEAEVTCGSLLASFSSISSLNICSMDLDLYIYQLFIIVLVLFIDCS